MNFRLLLGCLLLAAGAVAQPRVAGGSVHRLEAFPSRHLPSRTVDVWLPPGYTPAKRYAVLYMHDGQMLFDSTAT